MPPAVRLIGQVGEIPRGVRIPSWFPFQWIRSFLQRPLPRGIIPLIYLITPLLLRAFYVPNYYFDLMRASFKPGFRDALNYEVFDFIVVGGGSAGAAVANRLSRHSRVLLLEAGGDPHPLASIPIASPILLNREPIDWLYKTVPQKNSSFGFTNNVIRWPRGKTLGGSSVLNSMIYMRGHPKDYDLWANMTGDDSWRYDNVLQYFKKLETYKGNYPDDAHHGNRGPVHVERARFTRGTDEWLRAGRELGYQVRDQNGGQAEGFSKLDVTMKRGVRSDTHRSYLRPIMNRSNLVIYRYAHVYKVHLDRDRNAYGVSYYRHGMQKFVRANKEIILSAGTMGSALLLMYSGIGPKKHLNSKQIKCRVNLPVGKNLHDHPIINVGPFIINRPLSLISDRDVSIDSVIEYFRDGTGPLVSITGISSTALISSSLAPGWPDVLLFQIGAGIHQSLGEDQEKSLSFREGILQKFYKPSVGSDANFVSVMLGKVDSRGEILLSDKDPFSEPILQPRYLSEAADVQRFFEGIKFIVKIFEETKTYRNLGARLAPNPFPGCENYPVGSDDYWQCYIRFNSFTIHHQVGTCKMGKREDPSAVVDSKLRVLKTRRLRVIDASIMPEIINANPNVPTIMIGEKGAEEIRSYWASQYLVSSYLEYFINERDHNTKCFYSQLT